MATLERNCMETKEANKIIANYMGLYVHKKHIVTSVRLGRVNGSHVGPLYSESLDALVPVWEKLDLNMISIDDMNGLASVRCGVSAWSLKNERKFLIAAKNIKVSIYEAAAIATAKAIKELA